MKQIAKILTRELAAGTLDKTCSANERQILRQFVADAQIEEPYLNFGMANGWADTPKEVVRCVKKKHSPTKTGIGRCLTEIKCDLCRYVYTIDSSD